MDKYLKGIEKTGFGLEYTTSEALVSDGWTVINNKYYIDDVQGSAREIDILAYKVALKNKVQVYTVLIISCKQSQENTWALLAKSKNINDPNIDWSPVTLWSNEKIVKFMIDKYDWKKEYLKSSTELNEILFTPEKHIFAFQELNNKSGKAQNDRAIFNSIVSSMKSQNYEMSSLDIRKKQDSLYNFNLISVVDAPIIRIDYGGKSPSPKPIKSDVYVGSYIINKKETISRVHFISADRFSSFLPIYNKLHSHNKKQLEVIYSSYFTDCLEDEVKTKLFEEQFNGLLNFALYLAIGGYKDVDIHNISLSPFWFEYIKSVEITVNGVYNDDVIDLLNTNTKVKERVTYALKKLYHYEGSFHFNTEIPF